ncbi:MAG TPA: hypothetical protein VK308_06520 [Pyrinomonadaceae bacterium]|nr:hypothetical protein [Pyrinomonadaceae bacterium]
MLIYKEMQIQAETILDRFRADGLSLSVTNKQTLRIVGAVSKRQLEVVRLWKQNIIEALSPKCTNCGLSMQLIENGDLWFCPLGCESRKAKFYKS